MRSMTAYAAKDFSDENINVSLELKSYNNRFLDINIHLPAWLSILEADFRKYLSTRFLRGKIDLYIKVRKDDAVHNVSINSNAALSYNKAITELAKNLNIKEKPSLNLLLGLEGVLEVNTERDTEKYRALLNAMLKETSDKFEEERLREGNDTKENILFNLNVIEESLKKVSEYIPEMEKAIKENIKTRFEELLGDKIDEQRIFAETAMLLVKYSIAEEVSRLSFHLKEFAKEIDSNQSPGKKLDFLSQEMNREINTIGSKIPMQEVSLAVVEMKNALENIREQLRNVE